MRMQPLRLLLCSAARLGEASHLHRVPQVLSEPALHPPSAVRPMERFRSCSARVVYSFRTVCSSPPKRSSAVVAQRCFTWNKRAVEPRGPWIGWCDLY